MSASLRTGLSNLRVALSTLGLHVWQETNAQTDEARVRDLRKGPFAQNHTSVKATAAQMVALLGRGPQGLDSLNLQLYNASEASELSLRSLLLGTASASDLESDSCACSHARQAVCICSFWMTSVWQHSRVLSLRMLAVRTDSCAAVAEAADTVSSVCRHLQRV